MKTFCRTIFIAGWSVFAACSFAACSFATTRPELSNQKGSDSSDFRVSGEHSIKEDRRELDELRKDIPETVRKENDELAGLLNLMGKETEKPDKVRERFNKVIRDRRSKFDKALGKAREQYSKDEQKARNDFQREQKETREKFVKRKRTREESKEFFDQQESRRREFYSESQDKRREFEATNSDKRKDFEDYIREKTNAFNQEHRAYSKDYYDREKALALKKQMVEKERKMMRGGGATRSSPGKFVQDEDGLVRAYQPQTDQEALDEFKNLPTGPKIPLGPSDDN